MGNYQLAMARLGPGAPAGNPMDNNQCSIVNPQLSMTNPFGGDHEKQE